jgi:hypothetical protein
MYRARSRLLRILCGATFCFGCLGAGPAVPQSPRGESAEDLFGKPVEPIGPSGQVVVLMFVRTDCPISNRYAPLIRSLSERFKDKAGFWLVYPDAAETAEQIRAHVEEFQYSIPALRDVHHALVKRARATITPEVAVFDASGKLNYHGRIDNWYEDFGRSRQKPTTHELEDAIRNALEGKATVPDHADAVGCYLSDLK